MSFGCLELSRGSLELTAGCLELSVGCLELSVGCLDLSFGCLVLSVGAWICLWVLFVRQMAATADGGPALRFGKFEFAQREHAPFL